MTVYVDLLFIVNLMINTLLLAGATALARERLHRLRLLAAAALGALYSVLMFFPETGVLLAFGIKLVTGAVMVWLGIPTHGILRYLRALLYFYITLGAFGGGMYIFYAFTAAGAEMVYSNGIYYIDLPLWLLLLLSFIFYGLIRLAAFVQNKKHPIEGVVEIEICLDGAYRNVKAMLDTGNSLQDPLTLAPVVIVEAAALRGFLPEAVLQAAMQQEQPEALYLHYEHFKCRLLPYHGVGGGGLLLALRPDFIRLLPNGKPIENVLLGLSPQTLSEAGDYRALLHNNVF